MHSDPMALPEARGGQNPAWRLPWRGILVGYLAAILTGAAYALAVHSSGWWTGGAWEREMLLFIHRPIPAVLDRLLLIVPWLGTNISLAPALALAAFVLWRRGRTDLALRLVVVETGSLTLNLVLKALFERTRPDLWPKRGQWDLASFPSGHMIASLAVLFTIAIVLRAERGWRWPFVAAGVLLTVSLYSRLYLGVHWPTDVLGGLAVGLTWLAATHLAWQPRATASTVERQQ